MLKLIIWGQKTNQFFAEVLFKFPNCEKYNNKVCVYGENNSHLFFVYFGT